MITLPFKDYPKELVEDSLSRYSAYLGQLEKGADTGYLHWQLYVENQTPIRFSTLRRLFPKGHFEARRGSREQAANYVTKEATRQGDILQRGEIDTTDCAGKRTDIEVYHFAILADGLSAQEVLLKYPSALRYARMLEALQSARDSTQNTEEREVSATYIWGPPGCGKTRYAFDNYKGSLYRVTDYSHPFDQYTGQEFLVLDEFMGQLRLDLMLNILDRYPLVLPARYANKHAAFTTVLVLSNVPLSDHYGLESRVRREALRRRFGQVQRMRSDGRLVDDVPQAVSKTPQIGDADFKRLMSGG